MTKEDYFGGWLNVIPEKEMHEVISKLITLKNKLCPNYKDIFKAFNKCKYEDLRLIILGQDPYPQKDIATGIAFANINYTPDNNISPSLQVIKESVINYELPHNLITFANDLEEWEKQGVLLLNTALTCEINKPGSHYLLWKPFMSKLISNISSHNNGLIFLLLGSQAQSYETYINKTVHHIIKANHPSYYYRTKTKMPTNIWKTINKILIGMNGYGINFTEKDYEISLF